MLTKKTLSAFAVSLLATATALQPAAAQGYGGGNYGGEYDRDRAARDWRDGYDAGYNARVSRYDYARECERQRAGNQVGGLVIGALVGGIFGNAISRGPQRGPGTAVGAVIGGALGATIAGNMDCDDRGYAYSASYDAFERGRPHSTYRWSNPRSGTRGTFMVGDYYRGRGGARCATYSQTIWVHGRPQEARGYACRRRDGTWDIVD